MIGKKILDFKLFDDSINITVEGKMFKIYACVMTCGNCEYDVNGELDYTVRDMDTTLLEKLDFGEYLTKKYNKENSWRV